MTFLSDLWVDSWVETLPDIDFEARRAWLVGLLGEPAHQTTVAEGPAGPVGFVTVEADHLHQIVVAPAAKGSGVAKLLLHHAKSHRQTLTLDVNKANTRAIRFYAREGFVTTASGTSPASGLPTWRMTWPSLAHDVKPRLGA